MQNGFMLMMCRPTPSGVCTVVDYPHLECLSAEWMAFVPPMIFYLCVVGIVFLVFGVYIVQQQAVTLGETGLRSRGDWQIISQDFRSAHIYWPLVLQLKDILLNMIAACFGVIGEGMLQLLFAGIFHQIYAVIVLLEQPCINFSNSVNEIWMNSALCVLVFVIACSGLRQVPGNAESSDAQFEDPTDVAAESTKNQAYRMRELLIFLTQFFCFIGPV